VPSQLGGLSLQLRWLGQTLVTPGGQALPSLGQADAAVAVQVPPVQLQLAATHCGVG
jgi:hypothetical protein